MIGGFRMLSFEFCNFFQVRIVQDHANPWVGGCSHGCPLLCFPIAGWVPEVVFCGDEATNKKQH